MGGIRDETGRGGGGRGDEGGGCGGVGGRIETESESERDAMLRLRLPPAELQCRDLLSNESFIFMKMWFEKGYAGALAGRRRRKEARAKEQVIKDLLLPPSSSYSTCSAYSTLFQATASRRYLPKQRKF